MPEVKQESNNNVSKQFSGKLDNNLDSQLLNKENKDKSKNSEEENSAELRKEKKGNNKENTGVGALSDKSDIRKSKKIAERGKNSKLKSKSSKAKGVANQAMKKFSAEILKFSWEFLIPSWGATFIILDIYFVLRLTPLKFFFACDFGEEWAVNVESAGGSKKPEFFEKTMNKGKKGLKTVELMGLLIVNIIIFGIILMALTLISIILEINLNPLEFYKELLGSVFDLIVDLF